MSGLRLGHRSAVDPAARCRLPAGIVLVEPVHRRDREAGNPALSGGVGDRSHRITPLPMPDSPTATSCWQTTTSSLHARATHWGAKAAERGLSLDESAGWGAPHVAKLDSSSLRVGLGGRLERGVLRGRFNSNPGYAFGHGPIRAVAVGDGAPRASHCRGPASARTRSSQSAHSTPWWATLYFTPAASKAL